MYCTYEFYRENGGSMTETEWKTAAARADFWINHFTFGRAKSAPLEMTENIKFCECSVADILFSASQTPRGVSSESNDGVSIAYSQNALNELKNDIYAECRLYLIFPVNLMYAGSDGYA